MMKQDVNQSSMTVNLSFYFLFCPSIQFYEIYTESRKLYLNTSIYALYMLTYAQDIYFAYAPIWDKYL